VLPINCLFLGALNYSLETTGELNRAITMGNGPSSLQTNINHAAYFSNLRSIDHDLQTITSNRSSSSTLVSISAVQPGQQMKSTNPNPTTPFNSSSILQEANRVHSCSSKEFIRRSTFWKTVGAITGFFLIGQSRQLHVPKSLLISSSTLRRVRTLYASQGSKWDASRD
jgi:hypothetical protein